jgi:ATP-binding cassette subfamily B protein
VIFSGKLHQIKKTFITQLDRSDCGVACLLSAIRYFGGDAHMEDLRELSGTSKEGTTLLGLYQAAQIKGLVAEGLEGNIESLKEIDSLCILHVILDERFLHYQICYGFNGNEFIIGDPASGIKRIKPEELDSIWKSKYLLGLRPGNSFTINTQQVHGRLKWIKELLTQDMPILSMISILGLIISALGIVLMVFTQQMIDKILPSGNRNNLYSGLALVAFLLIIRIVLTYIRGHFTNLQYRDFNNRLIRKFYGSLLYLPKQFFNTRKTGELVARLEDTMRIQTVISIVFSEIFNDVFLILACLAMMIYYSTIVGMISLLSIPFFFLTAALLSTRIEKCQYEVMHSNAVKTGNYINTIQGIDSIKMFNRENHFSLLNEMIYGVFQHKVFSLGKISIHTQLLTDTISIASMFAVIVISSIEVFMHRITLGEFAAIVSVSGSLFSAIGNIAFSNIRLQGAKVAFNRMFEFAGINPEPDNRSTHKETDLCFESLVLQDIAFRFPGRKPMLNAVSIGIRKNEITAMTGECGSGKTTVLNILLKFYTPEKGCIRLNGQPFGEVTTGPWRKILGVVSQDISLFNGTLLYNVCLSHSPEEMENALNFCISRGFDTYFTAFPQGYSTLLGEEGSGISGGQKQLICLSRALYRNPQLLLLDEPTSSMDKQTEAFVIDLIKSLRNQTGIFIITHRNSLLDIADTVYYLQNGATTTMTPSRLTTGGE